MSEHGHWMTLGKNRSQTCIKNVRSSHPSAGWIHDAIRWAKQHPASACWGTCGRMNRAVDSFERSIFSDKTEAPTQSGWSYHVLSCFLNGFMWFCILIMDEMTRKWMVYGTVILSKPVVAPFLPDHGGVHHAVSQNDGFLLGNHMKMDN